MKQLTFGSLFAGIGGFDLGFERSGMVCKWQVEIDDYARRVLAKHWPNVRRWDDVRTFPPEEPIDEWKVDVICGGFPCQDISYAGRGAGLEGERSGLFFDAIRVVRQLKPRIVVLENVAALLTRGLDRVLGELAAIGFDAEWHCIPAGSVGAPHIRDRVFVLANASGERLSVPTCAEQPSVRETQGTSKGSQFGGGNAETGAHWKTEPNVGRVANGVPFELDCLGRGLKNGCKANDEKADATRVWTNRGFRLLRRVWEQRELATTSPRLFQERVLASVPELSHSGAYEGWYVGARIEKEKDLRDLWEEFYTKSFKEAQDVQQRLLERIRKTKRPQALAERTNRLRGLGNAVVPQVAEFIGRRIVEAVSGEQTKGD